MKIEAVKKIPYATSFHPQIRMGALNEAEPSSHVRRGFFLRLQDELGNIGRGECSPLLGYSRDTLAECERELSSLEWGRCSFDLSLPKKILLRQFFDNAGLQCPAAKCAVEAALLELMAKRLHKRVFDLLTEGLPAKPAHHVSVASVVFAGDKDEILKGAASAKKRGIQTIKVKVDGRAEWEEQHHSLRLLRQVMGPHTSIRLDANQSFTVQNIDRAFTFFSEIQACLIEEPLEGGLLHARIKSPLPVAADESLQKGVVEQDILEMKHQANVQTLVLKPMALGGLFVCMDLALMAKRCGLSAFVTHLWDGPVAMAFSLELARALPCPLLDCGLDWHSGLANWFEDTHKLAKWRDELPLSPHGLGLDWMDV